MVNDEVSPELSRPIKIKGLPGKSVMIEANASEREALAKRFGLPGIDTLHAHVALEQTARAIRASGSLSAAIRQTCAISGEDFPANIEESFDLRFIEEGDLIPDADEGSELEIELDADDCDEIGYHGDLIDIGEAVAQTLGLAIDPYAEGPNADAARARSSITPEDEQKGPLAEGLAAGLAALKKNE